VLVEKPFAMDAAEAREIVDAARERGTFLMEAMWTRFVPRMRAIRSLVRDGRIGDPSLVMAELSYFAPEAADSRLFSPALGGGALLDVGVCTVSFAQMLLGRPESVLAASTPTRTGVDATTSVILTFPGGAQALLTGSLRGLGERRAAVVGTAGRVEIDGAFYFPGGYRVVTRTADGDERSRASRSRHPGTACVSRRPRSDGACARGSLSRT
jgi:predicted dehydrogenase